MNQNTNLRPLSASLMLFLLFIITNKGWTQCNFSVNAGPDQAICSSNSTTQLNGSTTALNFFWSPATGLSNPNALNTQAEVTQTTTYTLTAAQPSGINLITNGDFSQGNSGFTSDYGFDNCPPNQWGSLGCEGAYVVTTNTGTTHSNFSSCTDHTSGGGNMMAVNGANNAINIWCQIIAVNPDTDYDFSAWATSLVSDSPARLQFSINGGTIGNVFNVSPATCNWQEFSATWNSGGNASATICVTNQNNAVGGNDFALDDIFFEELCTVTDEVTIEVVEISGQIETPQTLDCNSVLQCIPLNATGSSSISGMEYEWTASNGGVIQSGGNTANPMVCGEGTYTLIVSVTTVDGTVCTDDPQTIDVISNNEPPQTPSITGTAISCTNTVGNYSFTGPQAYQTMSWFVVGDGVIITDPEDVEIEVSWNSGGFGQVCLEVSNFCDILSMTTCYDVDILDSPEAPILTGPAILCPDGNPVTYSVDNLSPVNNTFIWSPPPGATLIQTGSDNTVRLLWDENSMGGTLCVDVENDCGLAPTDCLTITVNTPLNTILDTVVCGGTTFNYNNTIYGNGNFSGTENIAGFNGCDSLIVEVMVSEVVIQNISLDAPTCDEMQGGTISSQTLQNVAGCDSLILNTTLVYTAPVNEAITTSTCDPALDGTTSTETIVSVSNCDSVIITTTLVLSNIPVTENIMEVTCAASQNGLMSSETITGFTGCDSLILNTTLVYTAPVNEDITASTCDPALDGTTSTETIVSVSNCDSVFITTTFILSNIPVTENITEVTCDASQNGLMSTETITGFTGCDSLILNTTLVYTAPTNQDENAFTCDPTQAGNTTTTNILNTAGCDSIIITTTAVFVAPVTTNLTETSCDPEDVGISSQMLIGYQGCDSLVVTETIFLDINVCSVEAVITTRPIGCGDSGGNIGVTVNTGTGPFTVFWESNITGPLGSFEIINRGDIEMITGLEAGDYTITILSANGLDWNEVVSLTQEENFSVLLTAERRTNGFGVTCSESEDGSIQSEIMGTPSPPISYAWSNGQTGETLMDVAAGTYTLTVTDAIGCTATEVEVVTSPAPIDLILEAVDLTCFEENDGVILVDTVIGGSTPYQYALSDQTAGLNTVWFNLLPGNYGVTVTDGNGCTGSQITTVATPDEVIADLGPDQEITLGSFYTLDLFSNVLPNALDTIIWSGSDLEDCENCTAQEILPFFNSSYEVMVVDTSGCRGSDEINIQVVKDRAVYIPNVFSPNGDGTNDRFFISTSAEAVEILEMNIYNRWGAIVYSDRNFPPNNPGLGWNGIFKEKEVNSGVFVYYARIQFLDGVEKVYSGDLTVLK